MIPGDFQPKKPTGTQLAKLGVLGAVLLGVFIVVVLLLTFVISSWLGQPVIFAREAPDQPIAFRMRHTLKNLEWTVPFATEPWRKKRQLQFLQLVYV